MEANLTEKKKNTGSSRIGICGFRSKRPCPDDVVSDTDSGYQPCILTIMIINKRGMFDRLTDDRKKE